jgi:hypothetical protein
MLKITLSWPYYIKCQWAAATNKNIYQEDFVLKFL